MVMDGHRIIDVNGVDLCVDTTGDAADPTILLISGMGGSMDWWEEEFCQRLAAGGRFVIRYDHRDTGRSVSYPAGAPGYTGADLAADVVGVLDALGRRSAHLAGISMGGALAQQVALAYPDRVDSLVLISTSPAVQGAPGRSELPPMSEDLRAYFAAEVPLPDWAERTAVIDYIVGYERRRWRGQLCKVTEPYRRFEQLPSYVTDELDRLAGDLGDGREVAIVG